ncbi:hypothetical protein MIND_00026500 [Mycena indigotica]|uniref:F-box domain-containing protein n=1 Tax=Mycena indigotica TaxID=2126181 RepID=A0A8H6WES7_9AGAR|nr:uncharacterized protein MIND_00026500 [Mycena indigotica]KAF7315122.1 hypothetical protein MIND_00026500 [Mycena indigotica]
MNTSLWTPAPPKRTPRKPAPKRMPRTVTQKLRRPSPFLKVPPEICFEIMEFALTSGASPVNIGAVCKRFSSFVDEIIYKTVVLSSSKDIALFHRATTTKPVEFLTTHVRAVIVNARDCANVKARVQLEEILSSCRGVQTVVIPRPAILASPGIVAQKRLEEVTLQSFDAMTPFEIDPPFGVAPAHPAAHLSSKITHLRVCEPSGPPLWHSPLEIIKFFGAMDNLTHLALACWADPMPPNYHNRKSKNILFAEDIRQLLLRPRLKVVVVTIFAEKTPYWGYSLPLCGALCACQVLARISDPRLVLLAASCDIHNRWSSTSLSAANHHAPLSRDEHSTVNWDNDHGKKGNFYEIAADMKCGRDFWREWQ